MNSDDARQPLARGYRVMVDDNFHFMDEEERYCHGEFASYAEALAAAKKIVESSVAEEEGTDAGAIYVTYTGFGEDPFILAFGGAEAPGEIFSAWDYARICAERSAAGRAGEVRLRFTRFSRDFLRGFRGAQFLDGLAELIRAKWLPHDAVDAQGAVFGIQSRGEKTGEHDDFSLEYVHGQLNQEFEPGDFVH